MNRAERRKQQRHAKQRPRKPEHWLTTVKRDKEVAELVARIQRGPNMNLVVMDEISDFAPVQVLPPDADPVV